MRRYAICLIAVTVLSGCASSGRGSGAEGGTLSNSDIAVKVLMDGLVGGDIDVINQYVAEDYIQHNPMAETGRAGLIGFIEYLKQQPKDQGISMKIVRVFEDGEFVVTHSDVMLGGKRHAVFDVFRVQGGMLREHWDAIQEHPEKMASGLSMLDGETEISDVDKTEANKKLAREFGEEVYVKGDLVKALDYVDVKDFISHNPWVNEGGPGPARPLALRGVTMRHVKVVRVLGRGNFVLLQSRGKVNDKPAVLYDLLRIKAGKLAERWNVIQEIPAQSRNNNGMLPD